VRRLQFSAHALEQLEHALRAFDDRPAADRLAALIERRLRGLQRSPRAGRMVPELGIAHLRELLIQPFRLVCRVEARAIRVLAVVHMRRELKPALRPRR